MAFKDGDMPSADQPFEKRGGWVLLALADDYKLTHEQAAGIVGNLGFESGGFQKLHEIGQPEGKGGYGWGQWTASRREKFMAFCQAQEIDWRGDNANYAFLCSELDGPYAYCVAKLRQAEDLEDCVFTWGRYFEVPGGTTDDYLPGFDGRLKYAQRALAGSKTL